MSLINLTSGNSKRVIGVGEAAITKTEFDKIVGDTSLLDFDYKVVPTVKRLCLLTENS